MRSPVAVWAYSDSVFNCVLAIVFKLDLVVNFEIRAAVLSAAEWRRLMAGLANTVRSYQSFRDNIWVSSIDVGQCKEFLWQLLGYLKTCSPPRPAILKGAFYLALECRFILFQLRRSTQVAFSTFRESRFFVFENDGRIWHRCAIGVSPPGEFRMPSGRSSICPRLARNES